MSGDLPIPYEHLHPPIAGAFRRRVHMNSYKLRLQRTDAGNEIYIDNAVWKHT